MLRALAGTLALAGCGGGDARLPTELEPYRARIEASRLPYVAVTTSRKSGSEPWRSKFLGTPYLPKGAAYPRNVLGRPLVFLAQINFAEVPPLEDFPREGILEFYIDGQSEPGQIWGMKFPGPGSDSFQVLQDQSFFRILYFRDVTHDKDHLQSVAVQREPGELPIQHEALMRFSLSSGVVKQSDYRFEMLLGASHEQIFGPPGRQSIELSVAYERYTRSLGIARVGGYAEVVQRDPREVRPDEDWIVLFEIDSGDADGIDALWGDGGVANFFIRRADLRRLDFSRVAYYWDNA